MKNCPAAVMVGFILCAVIGNAGDMTMPDCVGVRPGMTPSEASQSLKSYDPKLEVRSVRVQIPQLGKEPVLGTLMVARMPADPHQGGFSIETVQAALTLPPNQPVVWKVFRSLSFKPDHEPAIESLLIVASAPPAIIASAYPCLIARKASPIAWVEVAQAVTMGRQGPCA